MVVGGYKKNVLSRNQKLGIKYIHIRYTVERGGIYPLYQVLLVICVSRFFKMI